MIWTKVCSVSWLGQLILFYIIFTYHFHLSPTPRSSRYRTACYIHVLQILHEVLLVFIALSGLMVRIKWLVLNVQRARGEFGKYVAGQLVGCHIAERHCLLNKRVKLAALPWWRSPHISHCVHWPESSNLVLWFRYHIVELAQRGINRWGCFNQHNWLANMYYRERKLRRNMLTSNHLQGEVRCCQIFGRLTKRGESHEWDLMFRLPVYISCCIMSNDIYPYSNLYIFFIDSHF